MNAPDIAGRRILVVEDETMITMVIEEVLAGLGCEVVGPVSRLDAAERLAKETSIDAAILDVTVRGGKVFPVAEILQGRGIPFLLASGYGEWTFPEALKNQPRLAKPYTAAELERAVRALFEPATVG
jgi:CheY-like chemotaxis protein